MAISVDDITTTLLDEYVNKYGKQVVVDRVNANLIYFGAAEHGVLTSDARWLVKRVLQTGSITTIESAPRHSFDSIWNDRATLFPAASFFNNYSTTFDGVNDYISFGDNYTFEISQAFSVSMWIKPNNLAATRSIISKASNDVNVYGWNVQHLITSGRIQLQLRSSGGTLTSHQFTSALTAGVWQHLTITYSGGSNINGARCYINSVVGDTPASSILTGSFANTANLTLGSRNTTFFFSGGIDEVAIWDKALSQSEVDAAYNSGVPFNLLTHAASSNLKSWWRMGDNDVYPTINDNKDAITGTMTNMLSGNFVLDVP